MKLMVHTEYQKKSQLINIWGIDSLVYEHKTKIYTKAMALFVDITSNPGLHAIVVASCSEQA